MIDTEQSAQIHAGIDKVWTYVKDISRWAAIMPGYQTCDIVDDNNSNWTLKVGVGGLVRTVKVDVHVEQWNGPEEVRFTYKLKGDPVQGGGTYSANTTGKNQTEITLKVWVEGSGPMAPMWEAMGKPLLPQFARTFADELKNKIEAEYGAAPSKHRGSWLAAALKQLQAFWDSLFARKGGETT